jgi:hypothetical protein
MSYIGRHRCDFTTLPYGGLPKLSLRVCLLLIGGTSLLLWFVVFEGFGVVP